MQINLFPYSCTRFCQHMAAFTPPTQRPYSYSSYGRQSLVGKKIGTTYCVPPNLSTYSGSNLEGGSDTMGSCIKALVNEILCEETVVLTHCNKGVAIGELSVPSNSNLAGQTLIRVLDCSPSFHEGLFGVRITLFVQEELELTTPSGPMLSPPGIWLSPAKILPRNGLL